MTPRLPGARSVGTRSSTVPVPTLNNLEQPSKIELLDRGEKALDFVFEAKSVGYFLWLYLLSRTKSCIFKKELVNTNIKVE